MVSNLGLMDNQLGKVYGRLFVYKVTAVKLL